METVVEKKESSLLHLALNFLLGFLVGASVLVGLRWWESGALLSSSASAPASVPLYQQPLHSRSSPQQPFSKSGPPVPWDCHFLQHLLDLGSTSSVTLSALLAQTVGDNKDPIRKVICSLALASNRTEAEGKVERLTQHLTQTCEDFVSVWERVPPVLQSTILQLLEGDEAVSLVGRAFQCVEQNLPRPGQRLLRVDNMTACSPSTLKFARPFTCEQTHELSVESACEGLCRQLSKRPTVRACLAKLFQYRGLVPANYEK